MKDIPLPAYFAAHAPQDIPPWFTHIPPFESFPADPMPGEMANEEDRNIIYAWKRGDIDELPKHLACFAEQWHAHRTGKEKWKLLNTQARYFQWRWYYAVQMARLQNSSEVLAMRRAANDPAQSEKSVAEVIAEGMANCERNGN